MLDVREVVQCGPIPVTLLAHLQSDTTTPFVNCETGSFLVHAGSY